MELVLDALLVVLDDSPAVFDGVLFAEVDSLSLSPLIAGASVVPRNNRIIPSANVFLNTLYFIFFPPIVCNFFTTK